MNHMFTLELYGSNGNKLESGDIVRISDGQKYNFFAEVKYLEVEQVIAPFHTFSFHHFEKVDNVPDHAIQSSEERYKIWFTHTPDVTPAEAKQYAEKYLIDWRQCEHLLEKRCFRIKLIDKD